MFCKNFNTKFPSGAVQFTFNCFVFFFLIAHHHRFFWRDLGIPPWTKGRHLQERSQDHHFQHQCPTGKMRLSDGSKMLKSQLASSMLGLKA